MRRFTIAPGRIDGDRVVFDRDETRHMAGVLRLAPGDLVVAADGRGRDYTVRIESLGETATGTVLGVATNRAEPALAITLVQGVPKGDKMELIVRAATELGVARGLPAITERTIVRLEPSRWRERARRWQRVAKDPLAEWLEVPAGAAELRLCLWEGEALPLARALEAVAPPPRVALVLVGPEGGLARREVELARAQGWTAARLGPRILRTETAGPAIAAILQFRFGDLGGGSTAAEPIRD
ncbi:MAG: hypothetical protein AUG00_10775 [Candidatus Rokubacteria bacterium 13_1_20CM_2_70_7]|nr:MAG: hypothetical protein AUG00_10775 [Candidatus Rokubacteria bacterium 13_1_20CM_2_70_7]